MATQNPSSIPLNQTNITGRRKPDVTVSDLRKRYKIDRETQQKTDVLDGYTVDIFARSGIQSVKLPIEAMDENTYVKIVEALKEEKIVKVNFGANVSTLRGKFYALINKSTGQLVQGISCNASEINLVNIEDADLSDMDDYEIDLN